jgi:aminopeptidase YwaD
MIAAEKSCIEGVLGFTRVILDRYRSRITGTEGCLSAAADIAKAFRDSCDSVSEECFSLHPGSLWNIGRAMSIAYALSLLLLAAGGGFVYAACAANLLALAYGVAHYIFFGSAFDWAFKRAGGCNISAAIEPDGPADRQILLSAHHDSPYVFSFLARFEKFAGIRFLLAMVSYLYVSVLCIAATATLIISGSWQFQAVTLAFAAAGAIFALPLFFFISKKPSPGAGDNLNASALAVGLSGCFAARRQDGQPLRRTRVLFLSADGEEVGMRGSAHYMKTHRHELLAIPTSVINIDSIYNLSDMTVFTSDRHGIVRLSPRMAEEIRALAVELGYPVKVKLYPFGGGGTDAASFAKAGLEAVSIVAMPTSLFRGRHMYHTLEDTIDSIEPTAVEAVFNIILNYIIQTDE